MFDTFMEPFEECNSTTINLKLLWMDKVWLVPRSIKNSSGDSERKCFTQYLTMDSEHIKYVYNSGFDKFWRGHTQGEMR